MSFRIELEGFDRLARDLGAMGREMERAVRMGINKTATKANTEAKRAIAAEFAIKQKDIAPRIAIKRAKAGHLEAEINPFKIQRRGTSLNLASFIIGNKERYLRKQGVAAKKQKKIKIRVKRGGPARTVRNAFLIRGRNSGKLIMMQRTGRRQYPIQAVRTVDVPAMFASTKVYQRVRARIQNDLPIEVRRALVHVISRRRAR